MRVRLRSWLARRSAAPAQALPTGPFDAAVTAGDVRAAYRLLLGRHPDPDGWHTYSALVGRADVAELAACLLSSEEFRRTTAHAAAIRRESEDLETVETGDGLRLLVSPHDLLNRPLYESGRYEEHLAAAIDECLHRGATACCVGANIGVHAIRAARRVGPEGRVFAFEARAANAALAARNAAANGAHNVVVLPLALSDRAALWRYVPAQGTNGYIEPVAPCADLDVGDTSQLVQSVRLDDLAPWIGRVHLLQLDVEGAEALVLGGARRVLTESRPVVLSELCLGQLARTSRASGEELLQALVDLDYRLEVLGFDGRRLSFGRDVAALVEHARSQSTPHVDVRLTPI